MRRSLRIFPLYYLVLFLSLVIFPLVSQTPESANEILDGQWKLWIYLSNVNFYQYVPWDSSPMFPAFGHFWTLSVEEHFYLLWPLLVYFSLNKQLSTSMTTVVFVSLLSWIMGYYIEFFNWTTLTYASALALGGLISYYEYIRKGQLSSFANLLYKKYYYILLLLFMVMLLPRSLGYWGGFVTYLAILVIFGTFILIAIFNNIPFLHSRFLIFMGKISYGLYVYHGVLRPFYREFIYHDLLEKYSVEYAILSAMVYTFISFIVTVAIAWISWEFFEKKVLRLKRFYEYKS